MTYDYGKLLGRMREKNVTQDCLANTIGIRPATLSQKLNNKAIFKQFEITKICDFLKIQDDEIGTYFFRHNVQKN